METTRIKKHASLRAKIEQEIKVLKLKGQTDAKLNYYHNKLDRISPHFLIDAQDEVNKYFPDLKSLVKNTTALKKHSLQEEKITIDKQLEAFDQNNFISPPKMAALEDYVPVLDSEEELSSHLHSWKKNQFYQKQDFAKMLTIKKAISKQKKPLDHQNIDKISIFTSVNKVDVQIQNYSQRLKKIVEKKKTQTKWLFFLGLFFFLGLSICLILIFIFF